MELPDGTLVPATVRNAPAGLDRHVKFFYVRLHLPTDEARPVLAAPTVLTIVGYDEAGSVIAREPV
ncbi:MAG: hypothetical protein U0R50_04515 [Gaiellales bacterium]